jgi:transposase
MGLLPTPQYVVGIDVGSVECSLIILHPDKTPASKPATFANTLVGFAQLDTKLTLLAVPPAQIVIGLEATGPYWENLYYFLQQRGYHPLLLHPGQTHYFAQQRALRAKTDRLDAMTIARLLLSDEARPAYVPSEQIASYRELVRLHTSLGEETTRYKLQIQGLLTLLFPEFSHVFRDPHGRTATALLQRYPSAAAFREAGVAAVAATLAEVAPTRYGPGTAQQVVDLAQQSAASGVARAAREQSLRILLTQLVQTQTHLAELAAALAALLQQDPASVALSRVPEFGPKTVAVLRAELGDVTRFARADEAVAYVGMDVRVRQSGKWRGQRKLSKRGSGPVRRLLYLAAVRSLARRESAFGSYYRHLVGQGVGKMSALMAVMRKMVVGAYRLLKSGAVYDPHKVWAWAVPPPAPIPEARAAA